MEGRIEIEAGLPELFLPTKMWYAFLDSKGIIVNTVGSMFPVSNLVCNFQEDLQVHELGMINEDAWKVLNKVVHAPYCGGYIDVEAEEIVFFRLKADVTNSEKIDGIYHLNDNTFNITATCIDETDMDVIVINDSLLLKKLRPPTGGHKDVVFTNYKPSDREIQLTEPTQQVKVKAPGRYTFRLTYNHSVDDKIFPLLRHITVDLDDS
jgi:hypothetical protein